MGIGFGLVTESPAAHSASKPRTCQVPGGQSPSYLGTENSQSVGHAVAAPSTQRQRGGVAQRSCIATESGVPAYRAERQRSVKEG